MNTSSTTIVRSPVVKFDYPDSQTNRMRTRYVRVADFSADWIKGEELDSAYSIKQGPFKCYLRNRIAKGQPVLISY